MVIVQHGGSGRCCRDFWLLPFLPERWTRNRHNWGRRITLAPCTLPVEQRRTPTRPEPFLKRPAQGQRPHLNAVDQPHFRPPIAREHDLCTLRKETSAWLWPSVTSLTWKSACPLPLSRVYPGLYLVSGKRFHFHSWIE